MGGEMKEEIKCKECDNWKRRGDEQFDMAESNRKEVSRLYESYNNLTSVNLGVMKELGRFQNIYDEKCDEYKKLILLNAKLRLLLAENGVDHDY